MLVACGGQARLCTWCQAGESTGPRLWNCIDTALSNDTDACGLTRLYGQADFQGPPFRTCREGSKSNSERVHPGTSRNAQAVLWIAPAHVRADILCGVMRVAGDTPMRHTLQDWLVQGAPLGMDRRTETTGVFPPADKPDKEKTIHLHQICKNNTQWCGDITYMSVLEKPEEAHKEFERYRAAQIAVDIDKDTLERLFPKFHVNKSGLIVKESPGTRKMRLVVDMKRSNANARAAVPECPILPRPRDIVADWKALFSEAASLGFTTNAGVSCENVTCDFSDAYCHVWVRPEELKNCFAWSRLRLLLLGPIKMLRSCVVWVLVRKVLHSRGAASRLLLEQLRKQC